MELGLRDGEDAGFGGMDLSACGVVYALCSLDLLSWFGLENCYLLLGARHTILGCIVLGSLSPFAVRSCAFLRAGGGLLAGFMMRLLVQKVIVWKPPGKSWWFFM